MEYFSCMVIGFCYTDKVILCLYRFQFRVYTVKQDRVHRFIQPHRRGVSRESHHQLGRNSVGEQTIVIMDCSSDTGIHKPNRSVTVSLSWIQGI